MTEGWGPWVLDTQRYVAYAEGHEDYEIDLETCTSPAQVLDWICQVAGKLWAGDALLAGLVRLLNDVLRPQATLCSFGHAKRLTVGEVRAQVERLGLTWPR